MKTIGLIGGITWISTIEYYRTINRLTQERLGGHHSAPMFLHSIDFAPFKEYGERNEWDKATLLFIEVAKKLESIGTECLVICANTPHRMAGDIQAELRIPLIHIATATGNEIRTHGIRKVGLLGTRYTMSGSFFKDKLAEQGIETCIPESEDLDFVHDSIYAELVKEIYSEETRSRYRSIIQKFANQGCGGVILGCTEIPLLIKQEDSSIQTFDTTTIHAKAAVEFALRQ